MRIFYRRSLALAFVVLAAAAAARADRVDDIIRRYMADRHIAGAAVAVIVPGKKPDVRTHGLASLEFSVPVTRQTAFEIGSVSKQMTAAAILLLVEDGKIALDDPVSKHLAGTPEHWRQVTIRHLLTHTSGIKSYSSLEGFELIKRQKVADFLKKLGPHPLEFTPGERTVYGNSGFTILAYVIEAAAEKPYIEFMRERIFRPLGMTSTTDRDPEYIIPNRATGYDWRGDRYAGRDWDLTDLLGAGTIVSTIDDMIKWSNALDGNAFLKPASRAEWWREQPYSDGKPSPYGFGWRISEIRGRRRIAHTGQTAGFTSANFRYVDDKVNVIVLTNTGESGVAGEIAHNIAKLHISQMSLRAMKPATSGDGSPQNFQLALRSRLDGKPTAEHFTDVMLANLATARSRAIDRRIGGWGSVKSVEFMGAPPDANTALLYRVTMDRAVVLWRVTVSAGRIASMTIEEQEY